MVILSTPLTGCQGGSSIGLKSVCESAATHDVQHGQQLLAHGDIDGAKGQFECAERFYSSSASAQAGLGQVAEKREQLEEAVAHYRAALKFAPENSAYAVALGNCLRRLAATSLERQTLLESAVRAYRHALTLAPNDYGALVGLAQCYRQQCKFDQAIEALRHAQRIDPPNPQVHTMLAAIYESLLRYDEAVEEYKLALKLDTGDAAVHNRLATLYLSMAKNSRQKGSLARERAIAHYRRSLQLDANQPDIRQSLAELHAADVKVVSSADESQD